MSEDRQSRTQQLCTFYLSDLFFGIEVEKVQEVIRFHQITPVPYSPPEVRAGYGMSYRGIAGRMYRVIRPKIC